jgi:outer membrane receptor protein involved in Fe transport
VTVDYYRSRHAPFIGDPGKVDAQGVDVSMNHFVVGAWSFQSSYSWFDHENAEAADLPSPNSPEHKAAAGLRYAEGRFDGDLLLRWTDDFRWVDGRFQGDVRAYETVDLNANYRISDAWKAGITIANLFDNRHHESFGGDLLGRRALGHVTLFW